jgi:hypothetical protein
MAVRALSSEGERFPDTEEVGGSNPPAPTIKTRGHGPFTRQAPPATLARDREGKQHCDLRQPEDPEEPTTDVNELPLETRVRRLRCLATPQ